MIIIGDALGELRKLSSESVDCCVTSPPYWGLRDYGIDGQIGLEETPKAFVGKLLGVFSEVRRILKPQGTLWLNLGDSYSKSGRGGHSNTITGRGKDASKFGGRSGVAPGLKPKDLVGIPWRVAFALQDDGWYLHFATFPPDLVEPCIKAGCPEYGVVLDPFFGAGTTGLVATQLRRKFIGIELNPEYADIARERIGLEATV